MKILCADSIPRSHIEILESMGHHVTCNPELDEHNLVEAIAEYAILIVRSTRVNAATLDNGNALKLVIRAGAGTNTIDKAHAATRNIAVCNVPGANAVAVAELALGLLLSIDRHIADSVIDLRRGVWNKKKYSQARGLYGQNLGIIGLGAVGFALAERARAFGLRILTPTKSNPSEATKECISRLGIRMIDNRDDLLAECDIVSLHVPLTPETRNMVDADFLAKMRAGAVLINTSRGEIVDEAALIDAMNGRGIRAGLDVYQNEPAATSTGFDSALANHPSVTGTHHIGASTEQAQTAVADGVVKIIQSFEDGVLLNKVN